jgi:hypothetical protein
MGGYPLRGIHRGVDLDVDVVPKARMRR